MLPYELLQVVVPKLIAACLTNEKEERSGTADSSGLLSLLQHLTVDADPLLYDYIRVCSISSMYLIAFLLLAVYYSFH